MKAAWQITVMVSLIVAVLLGFSDFAIAQLVTPAGRAGSPTIAGPFTSGNLSVFLIHGKNSTTNQKLIPLQEALERKSVIVRETGNVSELTIENLGNVAVFIQSGDIVKGGRQDRTMQFDMILPPKSGRVPINSFCVESGRWSRRGQENDIEFGASTHQLASKELKLAAKKAGDQQMVWDAVGNVQKKALARAAFASRSNPIATPAPPPVVSTASPSSLQLTLESKGMKDLTQKYVKDLSNLIDGKNDVIGYAFAINGKVNSVDVYSSNELFKKMWPKLISASAAEAFSELEQGKNFPPATAAQVKACMDDAPKGKSSEKPVNGRIHMVTRETEENILFETRDKSQAEQSWVHRNYMTK